MNINITKEQRQEHFRNYRRQVFEAFDKWEKAVLKGREQDDNIIMTWFQEMLDYPEIMTESTTWRDYPETPEQVKKYI